MKLELVFLVLATSVHANEWPKLYDRSLKARSPLWNQQVMWKRSDKPRKSLLTAALKKQAESERSRRGSSSRRPSSPDIRPQSGTQGSAPPPPQVPRLTFQPVRPSTQPEPLRARPQEGRSEPGSTGPPIRRTVSQLSLELAQYQAGLSRSKSLNPERIPEGQSRPSLTSEQRRFSSMSLGASSSQPVRSPSTRTPSLSGGESSFGTPPFESSSISSLGSISSLSSLSDTGGSKPSRPPIT